MMQTTAQLLYEQVGDWCSMYQPPAIDVPFGTRVRSTDFSYETAVLSGVIIRPFPTTAVRAKFHLTVKFQTDTCPTYFIIPHRLTALHYIYCDLIAIDRGRDIGDSDPVLPKIYLLPLTTAVYW